MGRTAIEKGRGSDVISILVSGGAGYIGSHTCVELIQAGYDIVVADNLVNASEEAVRRVERIVGRAVPFVKVDLCDPVGVRPCSQSTRTSTP